nr:Retrovirus-related Pol polyprotein from transposon TNT 1-94 [Ipomoea batatas]
MGYVNGSISPPPATLPVAAEETREIPTVTIPNPYFEVWSIIDAQLCACLIAIISPFVKNNLHGLTATIAIWSHLELQYNSLSCTHIFQLKEQLRNIQKGGDSIQKYLDSVVKIVAALDRAKFAIHEQDVILCVLRGLPSEYSSIKQNIRTNIATVTVAQVSSWLVTEELTLQMEQRIQLPWDCWHHFDSEYRPSIYTPQAFYASQSANSNGNWFLNTSANAHVTPDLSRLYSHIPYSGTKTVTSAGGHPLPIALVDSGLASSFGAPLSSSYKESNFFFRFFLI